MDAVAFGAQPHPARAERIVLARRHLFTFVAIYRVHSVIDDGELAVRAGRLALADGYRIHLDHLSVFKQRQLAIWNADDDLPRVRIFRRFLRRLLGRKLRCLLLRRELLAGAELGRLDFRRRGPGHISGEPRRVSACRGWPGRVSIRSKLGVDWLIVESLTVVTDHRLPGFRR